MSKYAVIDCLLEFRSKLCVAHPCRDEIVVELPQPLYTALVLELADDPRLHTPDLVGILDAGFVRLMSVSGCLVVCKPQGNQNVHTPTPT